MSNELDPITRKEMFLAKAAGRNVPALEPITREEYFLNDIAQGGGSSGGGALRVIDTDGTLNVTYNDLENAVNNNVIPIIAIPIDGYEGMTSIYTMSTFGIDNDKYVAGFGEKYFYMASSSTEYLKNPEQEDEPIG